MTNVEANTKPISNKRAIVPLVLGLIAILLGASAGFYIAFSGMIFPTNRAQPMLETPSALPDVAFVPVEPMVVSLRPLSQGRHLRFRADLEVPSQYEADVKAVMPRVVNVMNGYLRALETQDFESPGALFRLRSHLLRRIDIVTGPGRVNDLLIMEYVIN